MIIDLCDIPTLQIPVEGGTLRLPRGMVRGKSFLSLSKASGSELGAVSGKFKVQTDS